MSLSHSSSVLIVDDEPGIRLALRANFARQGWRAETAAGVREALELLNRFAFDLVVSDVRMPDGDGFEVLQGVRSLRADTGFVFLTAFGTVPQAVRAMQDGAVDYMTKPVSFEQLESVATKILHRQTRTAESGFTSPGQMVGRSMLSMEEVERMHLERTLELTSGNRTMAAQMLGISLRTVRNKIRQYDLPARSYA